MKRRASPRRLVTVLLACLPWTMAACSAAAPPSTPAQVAAPASRAEKLAVARAIVERVRYAALVTVDDAGQPRARTVLPLPIGDDFTVWVATRPGTRKLEQIAANPRVTLLWEDHEAASYVSLMGTATVRDDPEAKARHVHPEVEAFWPDYPDEYVLLEVRPRWLEVVGPGVDADPVTWRPQSVRFDER